LKWIKAQRPELRRYRIAIAAGLLLTLAFPKFNIAGLAWVAPGIMLAAAAGFKGGAAFRIGFVSGLVHHLGALYWLLYIPMDFPWKGVVVLGWVALGMYLAIFQGLWVWFGMRMGDFGKMRATDELPPHQGKPPRPSLPPQWGRGGIFSSVAQLTASSWSQRAVWSVLVAAAWVATEMIQSRFLSGFPWGLLGVSQYQMGPMIQFTSITGVYGVSFLLVWFSASLLCSLALLLRTEPERPTRDRAPLRQRWWGDLLLPVLVVALLFAQGLHRILHATPPSRQLKAALIQPSIPQTMIWDEREAMTRFHQVLDWSEKALAEQPRPELLVWPEAAVPNIFRWDTNLYDGKTMFDWITGFARDHQVWIIMGADDAEPRPGVSTNYFNSSFLINPAGDVLEKYRKRRLVIFGEYVPFSRWLPFLSAMVQSQGEFTPGDRPVAFRLAALNVTTSVLICFEDVFPHLAREYVERDTDFLLNLTNNGWFGESAAQWQHAASAVFRAVENNIPLVRCANNGLTCWVDRRGQMHDVYFPGSKDIYKAGYKIIDIPVGGEGRYVPTFYRRYGDAFGWVCVAATGLVLIVRIVRARKSASLAQG
jgi:apolipoprotein N-acyltransferase